MYSFHTHRHPEVSVMTYDRLTERPSGIIVSETLGSTVASTTIKDYGLEIPPRLTAVFISPEPITSERLYATIFGPDPACHENVTTVPDLDALVSKASVVWSTLVTGEEVHEVISDFREIRNLEEHITPSGLVVHYEGHRPTSTFVGFAASATEISAIEQITTSVLQGLTEERPGGYL